MIESKDHYWEDKDGKKWRVGDVVPVIRTQTVTLFNETIVLATCDMCDWECVGPTSAVQSFSYSHVHTHMAVDLDEFDDDFHHPDFVA